MAIHTDTQEARELFEYAINNSQLYYSRTTPIIDNLKKKIKKGTYDKVLALKLWRYAADDAAKKYNAEYMDSRAGFGIFTVPIRNEVATLLQEYYDQELHYEAGATKERMENMYGKNPIAKNDGRFTISKEYTGHPSGKPVYVLRFISHWVASTPLKSDMDKMREAVIREFKPGMSIEKMQNIAAPYSDLYEKNPVPRSSKARAAYINKKSQITKKPPTERLKKRRGKNTERGYFPNPVDANTASYIRSEFSAIKPVGEYGAKMKLTTTQGSTKTLQLDAAQVEAVQNILMGAIADKIALHFNAGNDANGNPRRVFVVVNTAGKVVEAINEGYHGERSVTEKYPGIAIVGVFPIKPVDYKHFLKQYEK